MDFAMFSPSQTDVNFAKILPAQDARDLEIWQGFIIFPLLDSISSPPQRAGRVHLRAQAARIFSPIYRGAAGF